MARRPLLVASAAAALVVAAFFSPAIVGTGQFLSRDAGRLHAPVKRWIAARLSAGELPEWNPYDGLGAPVVAAAVDAVQHPFNLLLVALPFDAGFKAWVLLSYLLAATGGIAWARALGCSVVGALAGGLAFALSGVLVSTSDNLTYLAAFAALPWLLAAGLRAVEGKGPGVLAATAVASGLLAAAGDPQTWALGALALPLQAILLRAPGGTGRGTALARGLLALGAAVVGAAPFVLPVVAWLPHSARAAGVTDPDRARYALAPVRLLELALPRLTRGADGYTASDVYRAYADPGGVAWYVSVYVGASVLALAAAAATCERRSRRLLLVAAILAWAALGHHAGFGQLAARLPVLSGLRFWEKLTVWPALLCAASAALGLDALRRGDRRARAFSAVAAASALPLAALGMVVALAPARAGALLAAGRGAPTHEVAERFAANLAHGLLAAALALLAVGAAALLSAHRRTARLAPLAILLVVILDVAAGNATAWRLSPAALGAPHGPIADLLAAGPGLARLVTPFEILERRHPGFPELAPADEAWAIGGRLLFPSWNVARRVGNFEPGGPMGPERVAAFVGGLGSRRLLPAAGMWGVGYVVVPRAAEVAATVGLPPPHEVAGADPVVPAFLVRVPHRPRAYLAEEVVVASRAEAFAFAAEPGAVRSTRTVLEGPIPGGWRRASGSADIVRDLPEEVEVAVAADGPALLVLGDAFAAGWRATVDGRAAPIHPANALARGVWVEAGSHRVRFHYRTPGLRLGWAILAAGAAGLCAWAAARRRRPGRPERQRRPAEAAPGASGS